jgi:Fe-S cluster biogenesis protein NfuA
VSAIEPDSTLMQAMARIDALLGQAEQISDPAVRENVTDIIQSLLELHGQALSRLLDLLTQRGDQARPILEALEADQFISSVLLVHGLHPRSTEQRVQRALQQVQPYLAAHNGRVDLLEVTPERVVRLRLEGDCRGCPGSQATLSNLINEAIFMAAPDVTAVEIAGATDAESEPPTEPAAHPEPAAHSEPAVGKRQCTSDPPPDSERRS